MKSRVMPPQAKEHLLPPEAERGKEGFLPYGFQGERGSAGALIKDFRIQN